LNTYFQILAGRGNNLHEVEDAEGQVYLVSMPTKYRKNVWIKRGDYVLTAPIEEGEKVKAEIISILYSDQIKYISSQGKWPQRFTDALGGNEGNEREDAASCSDSDSSNSDDLFVNTNRHQTAYQSSEEDSDSVDDEDE